MCNNFRLRNTITRHTAEPVVAKSNTTLADPIANHAPMLLGAPAISPPTPLPPPSAQPSPPSPPPSSPSPTTPPGLSWHQDDEYSPSDAGLGGASPVAQTLGVPPSSNTISPPRANTSSHATHALSHTTPLTHSLCT